MIFAPHHSALLHTENKSNSTTVCEGLRSLLHSPGDGGVWLTWFEVIVDDGRSDLVEILQSVDDLHDDRAAFLLRHQLVLLQVEVQVVALTVLQDGAEPGPAEPEQRRGR